jgi:hypothetical protein
MTPVFHSLTPTWPGRLARAPVRHHGRLPIFWLPPIRKSLEWVIPDKLTASQRVYVHCTNFLDSGGKEAGNSQNSHFG